MSIFEGFPIRTHIDVPGYAGSSSLNLSKIDGGTNLPPKKWCRPKNFLAHNFGAVKETYTKASFILEKSNNLMSHDIFGPAMYNKRQEFRKDVQ